MKFLLGLGAIILTAIAIIMAFIVVCACRIMWAECSRLITEKKHDNSADK